MRGNSTTPGIIYPLAAVAAVVALVLLWATVAQAQTPNDAQYGSPTASGTAAVSGASVGSGGVTDPSCGKSSSSASSNASDPSDPSDPSGSCSGASTGLSVLPATGGSLLFVAALGTIAIGATGLLVLRRVGS